MQMLEQLVLSQGISTDKQSGLTCRALSECGCSGIHHPAEPVRKVAERVLVLVYKINPRLVRKQLPPDDDITRRNLLYRQLFTEFDKLDAHRRSEMQAANKAAAAAATVPDSVSPPSASGAKMYPVAQPKSVKYESSRSRFGFNGSTPSSSKTIAAEHGSPVKRILKSKSGHTITVTNDDVSSEASSAADVSVSATSASNKMSSTTAPPATVSHRTNGKQPQEYYNEHLRQTTLRNEGSRKSSNADSVEEQQDNLESNCSFCDWSFVGDGNQLDKHYWKACPILTKCPQCSQVLEVAALNCHLTSKRKVYIFDRQYNA